MADAHQAATHIPACVSLHKVMQSDAKRCETLTLKKTQVWFHSVLYSQPDVFTMEIFYVYIQIYERILKLRWETLHGKGPRRKPKIDQGERNEASPVTLSRDLT